MEPFNKAALYVKHPVFLRWLDNPAEPRAWTGAADFLGLNGTDANVNPKERLKEIRTAIQAAFDLCKANDTVYLIRGGNADSPIHVSDLANLLDFLDSLTYRFPEALKKRGKDERADKDGDPFWDWD